MLKIDQQDQLKVDQAMSTLYSQLGSQADDIFKTITSDNGSEFAGIYELLTGITDVFFAHPYASHEQGTKEKQHKLITRSIPKGKRKKETSTRTTHRITKR